ncbi:unnamed protein product, partial [Polarella glacialis]
LDVGDGRTSHLLLQLLRHHKLLLKVARQEPPFRLRTKTHPTRLLGARGRKRPLPKFRLYAKTRAHSARPP